MTTPRRPDAATDSSAPHPVAAAERVLEFARDLVLLATAIQPAYLAAAQDSLLERIGALHTPDDRWSCGARSPQPVLIDHPHGRGPEPVQLVCSLDDGHDGAHKDGVHCYTTHEFTDAVPGVRRDWRTCGCGLHWASCPTGRLLSAA